MKLTKVTLISIFTLAVGCLVLFGWTFDIEVLKRISPGFVAMNPLTAICFILLGFTLTLLEKNTKNSILAAKLLGFIVFCLALIKLVQAGLGSSTGIDSVLFTEALSEPDNPIPNRMAPNTAFTFFALGLSVLLFSIKVKSVRIFQIFVFFALIRAGVSILGYLFNLTSLYAVASFTPMALHSAITFFILSIGMLMVCPFNELFIFPRFITRFKNLRIAQKFLFGFGFITILLLCSIFYISHLLNVLSNADKEQERISLAAESALLLDVDVLRTIIDIEEYKEDKNIVYLQDRELNKELANKRLQELETLTRIPAVQTSIDNFKRIEEERESLTLRAIEAIQANASPSAIAIIDGDLDEKDLEVRRYLRHIVEEEKKALRESIKTTNTYSFQLTSVFIILFSLVLVLIIAVSLFISQSLKDQIQKLIEMAEQVAGGNFDVKVAAVSADEAGELAEALNSMVKRLKESDSELRENNAQLISSVKEVESSKVAVLNILEDLTTEKKKLELANAKDEAIFESIGW